MDKIIPFSHKILKEIIKKEDICVDMTCGNGFDTLFLAEISKLVYGFDIQKEAIENTKEKVNGYNNVVLVNDSHDNVLNYVNEDIKGAIYNLGYLPTGDKNVYTKKETTISSLKKLLTKLVIGGRIVIVCYPGFESGMEESIELEKYLTSLNQKIYSVVCYKFINQINDPPFVFVIERDK